MSKKQYILAVLEKIVTLRGPADHIKTLLEQDQLTDDYIDYLYEICVNAVQGALNKQKLERQSSIISKLTTIKDAELKQTEADQQDIKDLEQVILGL